MPNFSMTIQSPGSVQELKINIPWVELPLSIPTAPNTMEVSSCYTRRLLPQIEEWGAGPQGRMYFCLNGKAVIGKLPFPNCGPILCQRRLTRPASSKEVKVGSDNASKFLPRFLPI